MVWYGMVWYGMVWYGMRVLIYSELVEGFLDLQPSLSQTLNELSKNWEIFSFLVFYKFEKKNFVEVYYFTVQ